MTELRTRWIKILKDIWQNKSRSVLVILSIAVGIAAVGMINAAKLIVERDLYRAYQAGGPASLEIYVSPFEKELAGAVESLREVEKAEPRRAVDALIYRRGKEKWEDITLVAVPNLNAVEVSKFVLVEGSTNATTRSILLERQSAKAMGVRVGDKVVIRMPDDRQYTLQVAGIVHDVYIQPFNLMNEATGYVRMETLQWMGEAPYYNKLNLVVAQNPYDRAHVLEVGHTVRDRVIEPAGFQVFRVQIPGVGSDPGQHWAHNQIQGFLLILQIMGVMAILLSAGLIVNTISAVLMQQTRQIGILRAVGGVRVQLVLMYFVYVLILSVLALLLALPLGWLGAWGISSLAARFLNFDITEMLLPSRVILWQVALGLFMPALVALYPILEGTRISVYNAVYQSGIGTEHKEDGVRRLLMKLKGLSPPVLLSLRNTFRRKSRLVFTLVTLTLAGAMFISVFSTRASLTQQIQDIGRYFTFDVALSVPGGTGKLTAVREALRVPGVEVAEGWANANGVILHDDGGESKAIEVVGIPYDAITIDPILLAGRWLQKGDVQHIVVNDDLLESESGLSVGSYVRLKVGDVERWYTVVGIASKHLSGPRVYMPIQEFWRLTGRHNQVDVVRVRASAARNSDVITQNAIAAALEERYKNAGLSNLKSTTRNAIFADFTQVFDIILIVLVIMAVVLSIVGGLGLSGVMGLNVLERTREIGVLRAIGASNASIFKLVIVEGVTVALMSWASGAVLSVPSGLALAAAVIHAVLRADLNFRYSYVGLAIWLAIVVLIGIFSSLAPARSAARLTVREVLEYE